MDKHSSALTEMDKIVECEARIRVLEQRVRDLEVAGKKPAKADDSAPRVALQG